MEIHNLPESRTTTIVLSPLLPFLSPSVHTPAKKVYSRRHFLIQFHLCVFRCFFERQKQFTSTYKPISNSSINMCVHDTDKDNLSHSAEDSSAQLASDQITLSNSFPVTTLFLSSTYCLSTTRSIICFSSIFNLLNQIPSWVLRSFDNSNWVLFISRLSSAF